MFYGKENIQIYTGTPDVRKYRHPCCRLVRRADSVCLVAVLKEIIEKEQLDIRLLAVHVNHGIRGTEAERDEQFAKQLCRQLSVEYISRRVDVPSVAHQEKLSEEEAGRILRYRIFKEIATQQEKHTGRKVKIAVAHHQNDQAETVLMNLVRGSSLRGIAESVRCGTILSVRSYV